MAFKIGTEGSGLEKCKTYGITGIISSERPRFLKFYRKVFSVTGAIVCSKLYHKFSRVFEWTGSVLDDSKVCSSLPSSLLHSVVSGRIQSSSLLWSDCFLQWWYERTYLDYHCVFQAQQLVWACICHVNSGSSMCTCVSVVVSLLCHPFEKRFG